MGKVDNRSKNRWIMKRNKHGNSNKESTRNARNQKNAVSEMKNAFDGFIRRLDIAEGRISELQYYMTIETELKNQEKKKSLKQTT